MSTIRNKHKVANKRNEGSPQDTPLAGLVGMSESIDVKNARNVWPLK